MAGSVCCCSIFPFVERRRLPLLLHECCSKGRKMVRSWRWCWWPIGQWCCCGRFSSSLLFLRCFLSLFLSPCFSRFFLPLLHPRSLSLFLSFLSLLPLPVLRVSLLSFMFFFYFCVLFLWVSFLCFYSLCLSFVIFLSCRSLLSIFLSLVQLMLVHWPIVLLFVSFLFSVFPLCFFFSFFFLPSSPFVFLLSFVVLSSPIFFFSVSPLAFIARGCMRYCINIVTTNVH